MNNHESLGKISLSIWVKVFMILISIGLSTFAGVLLSQGEKISDNQISIKQLKVKVSDHIKASDLIDHEKTKRLEEKIESVKREQKMQYDNLKEQLNRILQTLKTLESRRG